MNPSTKIILSILFTVIVVGFGTYYIVTRKATPTTTTTPSPTTDETVGWKTYSDEKLGYTIKYPNDWKIDDSRSSTDETVFDTGIAESREAIKVEDSAKSLTEWVDSFDKTVIVKVSDLTVDGQPAKQVDTSEFGITYVGAKKDGKLYTFTTGGRMITNGMLDTFQFTK